MFSRVSRSTLHSPTKLPKIVMPFGAPYVPMRKVCNWEAIPREVWSPRQRIQTPDYEIVTGGMAAGVGILWALKNHPVNAHKKIIFISDIDWIENMLVHVYGGQPWGQCVKDLPDECIAILISKYPYLTPDSKPNLEQILFLRTEIYKRLEEQGNVEVYRDRVTQIEENGRIILDSLKVLDYPISRSFHYNHARTPNTPVFKALCSDGTLHTGQAETHSVCYSMNQDDFAGAYTVLFGTSVSSAWSYQHFEVDNNFTKLVCLGLHGTDWATVPANARIDVSKIIRLMLPPTKESLGMRYEAEFEIYKNNKINKVMGINPETLSPEEKEYQYLVACAAEGYAVLTYHKESNTYDVQGAQVPFGHTDITASTEEVIIRNLDPKSIKAAAGIRNCPEITQNLSAERKIELCMTKRQRTSVQNVPAGSLMDSLYHYHTNCQNPPPNIRGNFPYVFDTEFEQLLELKVVGTHFNAKSFFSNVRLRLGKLEDSPSAEELTEIWHASYIESHPNNEEEDWEIFASACIAVTRNDQAHLSELAKEICTRDYINLKSEAQTLAEKNGVEFHPDVFFDSLEHKYSHLDHEPTDFEKANICIEAYAESNPEATNVDLSEFQSLMFDPEHYRSKTYSNTDTDDDDLNPSSPQV